MKKKIEWSTDDNDWITQVYKIVEITNNPIDNNGCSDGKESERFMHSFDNGNSYNLKI